MPLLSPALVSRPVHHRRQPPQLRRTNFNRNSSLISCWKLRCQPTWPRPTGGRLIVPISDGTFTGPRLKGTIVLPSGDWVVQRPDGSRLLDVRILLQTDDGQKIYTSWRGIAYTPPGGALWARIVPMFETASAKNAWLNNVVAVGVYRPDLGKIAYRVYRIL
ncbi:MAG: DUF3237 domain-containing protein [Verrucomicrobia bacterium]|nr:MAG: DUF3237 domain-containing protein [Verrucomicrobiota bacterium]